MEAGACLDDTKIAMTSVPTGNLDHLSGRAGAAAGLTEVSVFEDALLQKLLSKATVSPDGSFGPVRVGDNAHAAVWLQAGGPDCEPLELANDIEATTTSLVRTPPAIIESGEAVVEFTCGQPPCTFTCQMDAMPATPCTSPLTLRDLSPGNHELRIRSLDAAGNTELIPTEFSFRWATGQANVTWTSTPAATGGQTAQFAFTCDKSDCVLECQLDDAAWQPCTSPHALTGLRVGGHTFRVRTHGDAAAAQAPPTVFSWMVAKTPRGEP